MTEMKDMQARVDEYIRQFKVGYFSPLAMMARLSEETGELAREINHHYGEKQKKSSETEKAIAEELGDVLFVLITMANSLEIDLEEAFEQVMMKFEVRDYDRFERVDEQERTGRSNGAE
ncbi:nucleotide pyrophosphohydrolase [Dolosigranulum pigrum]|uniref:nucleotide pyrophosphohydrolase n=1 Tax=Dolosigranulum pigrum TaxID=29394 RepID=UPI000DC02BD9|nr:nucleotide pyrophosphohydrolase [Dolosigranulum pigrum]RAN56355.1 nucleotide pyrophosphohydrolase [Dolosigranulum pigrum]